MSTPVCLLWCHCENCLKRQIVRSVVSGILTLIVRPPSLVNANSSSAFRGSKLRRQLIFSVICPLSKRSSFLCALTVASSASACKISVCWCLFFRCVQWCSVRLPYLVSATITILKYAAIIYFACTHCSLKLNVCRTSFAATYHQYHEWRPYEEGMYCPKLLFCCCFFWVICLLSFACQVFALIHLAMRWWTLSALRWQTCSFWHWRQHQLVNRACNSSARFFPRNARAERTLCFCTGFLLACKAFLWDSGCCLPLRYCIQERSNRHKLIVLHGWRWGKSLSSLHWWSVPVPAAGLIWQDSTSDHTAVFALLRVGWQQLQRQAMD